MTRPFDSSPDSNTEILDIYRAYMLELFFLANKANMCNPPLPYMELKELVDRSGEICKRWPAWEAVKGEGKDPNERGRIEHGKRALLSPLPSFRMPAMQQGWI